MKRSPIVTNRRGGALVCCLAAFVFLAPDAARAGVTGSRHDFTGTSLTGLTPRGNCSACHIPHFGQNGKAIWSRSLAEENSYFDQTVNPNYAPGNTVLCYDCHDNHAVTPVDDDPPDASFNPDRLPQDVAFDNDMKNPLPANKPRDGSDSDDIPGYYENIDSNTAGADSSYISGHYIKSNPGGGTIAVGDKLPCADCHDPHSTVNQAFIKATLGGVALSGKKASTNMAYSEAADDRNNLDSRNFCIACHGTSDQETNAAVLFSAVNPLYGTATIVKPKTNISAHSSTKTGACTGCHKHNSISVSCSDCHGFPPLRTFAQAGNKFFDKTDPLLRDVENYLGGAGAHQRHRDALGEAIFRCEICHGPDPGSASWHNFGGGLFPDPNPGQNVDIMGLESFWGAGSSYNQVATGGFTGSGDVFAFAAKGGADAPALSGRCGNLVCHGNPPTSTGAVFLNWTDKLVDDTSGDLGGNFAVYVDGSRTGDGAQICKWCHDATPARIGTDPWAPNVLGAANGATGVWTTGGWGADVNGHGLATGNYDKDLVGESTPAGVPAANKQCTVCHDARYTTNALPAANTPIKTHFDQANDSANKRLRGTINGVTTIADEPDNTCPACHQVTSGTDVATAKSRVVSHGNSSADSYKKWEPDLFTRNCRQCHEPHGANWNGVAQIAPGGPRNLHMIGKWVDVNNDGQPDDGVMGAEAARVDSDAVDATVNIDTNDLPVIMKSSGGLGAEDNSWDDGNNDGYNPPDSLCVVCHVTLTNNHSQIGDSIAQNTPGSHMPVGTQCRLCHQHGELSTHPNAADDAFGPLSCFACHGTPPLGVTPPPGQLAGQYWPDGRPSAVPAFNYSNNYDASCGLPYCTQLDAHRKHIDAIAWQIFGQTAAELVLNYSGSDPVVKTLTSFEKQLEVCWFCHYDPGGADVIPDPKPHFEDTDTDGSPSGRVEVLQGGSASHYFRKFTAGVHPTYGKTNFGDDNPGGAYNFTTDSCGNLVCHNQNATPAASATGSYPGWNIPPDWILGNTGPPVTSPVNSKCSNTTCHAAPATYTLAHGKHLGGGVGQKSYECSECHALSTVAASQLQHGNGEVDMQWENPASVEGSFGGANGFYDRDREGAASAGDTGFAYKNSDGPYTDYNATCLAIYCHGADTAAAGQLPGDAQGSDTTPQWGIAATAACGTCHGVSTQRSLSHPKHAGGAAGQYAIGCQVCHYGTTQDGAAIASQTLHVNTSAEVSFGGDSRVDVNSSYGGDAVMGSGYGTCSETYCHSRGNDTAAPYNDVPLSVPIAPLPAWGDAGPLSCSSCHGNPTLSNSMPEYIDGTPKANKHDIHSTGNQFSCDICHYPTTHTNGTSIDGTTFHVNGSYDAGPNTAGPALYQFSWASPNCNAVVCHGGNGAITWATAGPYTCNVCHSSVGGVVTDIDVDDFAWAGATPMMSKVGNADYVAAGGGHGDSAGPNQPCSGCHASGTAATHDTTAGLTGPNPFRLADQNTGSSGVQYSCSAATGAALCHTGSSPIIGPRTGVDIRAITTHTAAKMLNPGGYTAKRTWPSWTNGGAGFGLDCANCHDPHGDGNLSMVNRAVYDKAAFFLGADLVGVTHPPPAMPTEQFELAFTDDTTGYGSSPDSFVWQSGPTTLTDYSGICQECHEAGNIVSFKDGGPTISGANHPYSNANPGDCSTCHRHDQAFRPTLCGDCHGTATSVLAPYVTEFYNVNGHGAKTFDPDGLGPEGTRAVDCSDCHELASPDPTTHLTGTFETYSFPGAPASFGAPNTNTSHLKSAYFGSVSNEQDWQVNFDDQCFKNIYCHKAVGASGHVGHRHETTHKDGVVRFGDHSSVADPKQDRTVPGYWTPWTIHDITTAAPPTTGPTVQYAPCVACHDPHGVDYSGYTTCADAPDGNYHMVRKNFCDQSMFCNSNCHRR